jgi:23S rRNA pseudouridine1911/1915/1917 synthase
MSEDKLILETHVVGQLAELVRISDYFPLATFKQVISRKAFKKSVKEGLVYLNGKRAFTADYVREGDCIEIYRKLEQDTRKQIEVVLPILFEDDYLAIVHKPAGMVVSGNKRWTLENALKYNLQKSREVDALEYPEPIHRLDYPTTGALLIGKTAKAVLVLNQMFEKREIEKVYYAVCIGTLNAHGFIESKIDDKPSKSEYHLIDSIKSERYACLNLVKLIPHTGRRHQLRKHLASIGNPIFGDLEYGKEGLILKGKGLYLHAHSLSFKHPFTGESVSANASFGKKYLKLFPDLESSITNKDSLI